MQHVQSGLFQCSELLSYKVLKCLVIHKSWQLSATMPIFKFHDLVYNFLITYRQTKRSELCYRNHMAVVFSTQYRSGLSESTEEQGKQSKLSCKSKNIRGCNKETDLKYFSLFTLSGQGQSRDGMPESMNADFFKFWKRNLSMKFHNSNLIFTKAIVS